MRRWPEFPHEQNPASRFRRGDRIESEIVTGEVVSRYVGNDQNCTFMVMIQTETGAMVPVPEFKLGGHTGE